MSVTAEQFLAWERRYLGTHEIPPGSNDGPAVHWFQSSTGAYRAAWCVSFPQKGLQQLGVPEIADRSAGVFYCANWARRHGCAESTPHPGYLGCLIEGQGHMVTVEKVYPDGSFDTIEGNHHDAVARDHRSTRDFVFIRIPGIDYGHKPVIPPPKPKPRWVPRFQIVSGETGKTHVLIGWHKWAYVQARIPSFVARKVAIRIQRKLVLG